MDDPLKIVVVVTKTTTVSTYERAEIGAPYILDPSTVEEEVWSTESHVEKFDGERIEYATDVEDGELVGDFPIELDDDETDEDDFDWSDGIEEE